MLAAGLETGRLAGRVEAKFSGRRWAFPSKVYADAPLVYPGLEIDAARIPEALDRLGYRRVAGRPRSPGEYRRTATALEVIRRPLPRAALAGGPARVRILLDHGRVSAIETFDGAPLHVAELEPEVIAGLYEGSWEERREVGIREVPALLVKAIIALEDRRFFEHHGIDLVGVARALLADVRAGRIVQGGSTLTQQLMKNFFLSGERTIRRKLVEVVMALLAEWRYSKIEILENYLNEIYLGQNGAQGIFGVWEASRFYFGKEPRDLSAGEIALLAGLIRAPNRYSPFRHPRRAAARRAEVLRRLQQQGEITEAELAAAMAEPLPSPPGEVAGNDAPYFVDYVRRELAATYPEDVLTSEGLAVETALDPHLQRAAERALAEGLAALERGNPRLRRRQGDDRLQGCLVALRPQTGEILALVGGRDYARSQFNRVAQARRQPGSAFKPIVYLAAFEHVPDLLPTSRLEDTPFTWWYEGRAWSPANYREHYLGSVTVRQALEYSLNAATARLARQVGPEVIRDTAYRLGIRSELPAFPSLALGAAEVTPLELVTAYAALANGGVRPVPVAVKRVITRQGEVVERRAVRAERVTTAESAYMVTHLLEGVIERGTGRGVRARGFNRPAAGKTGTTNDARDAWFVGYTPDLVAGVWVGFDQGEPLGLTGAQAALPIWTAFMKQATRSWPAREFVAPPGIDFVRVDRFSGARATPACPDSILEAFPRGRVPARECELHKVVVDAGGGPPRGGAP